MAGKQKKDSPEEMQSARAWLNSASAELAIEPELTRAVVGDLLQLTKHVAHGPSRPAAPVTAFLVGLASGKAAGSEEVDAEAVREKIARIDALLEKYSTE